MNQRSDLFEILKSRLIECGWINWDPRVQSGGAQDVAREILTRSPWLHVDAALAIPELMAIVLDGTSDSHDMDIVGIGINLWKWVETSFQGQVP